LNSGWLEPEVLVAVRNLIKNKIGIQEGRDEAEREVKISLGLSDDDDDEEGEEDEEDEDQEDEADGERNERNADEQGGDGEDVHMGIEIQDELQDKIKSKVWTKGVLTFHFR
jgi:hypothetical protein